MAHIDVLVMAELFESTECLRELPPMGRRTIVEDAGRHVMTQFQMFNARQSSSSPPPTASSAEPLL
jgi:hypothetical protein